MVAACTYNSGVVQQALVQQLAQVRTKEQRHYHPLEFSYQDLFNNVRSMTGFTVQEVQGCIGLFGRKLFVGNIELFNRSAVDCKFVRCWCLVPRRVGSRRKRLRLEDAAVVESTVLVMYET
jgi:hypothetical protein